MFKKKKGSKESAEIFHGLSKHERGLWDLSGASSRWSRIQLFSGHQVLEEESVPVMQFQVSGRAVSLFDDVLLRWRRRVTGYPQDTITIFHAALQGADERRGFANVGLIVTCVSVYLLSPMLWPHKSVYAVPLWPHRSHKRTGPRGINH